MTKCNVWITFFVGVLEGSWMEWRTVKQPDSMGLGQRNRARRAIMEAGLLAFDKVFHTWIIHA